MKAKVPLEPIDSRWQFAYYAIACVHFGQPRKRSNGIRCNQRHLALGCTAKLTISYDRKFQCLVLRNCTLQHNREIGSAVIKHYASNQKLSMQEQLELNEVLELRPNNKHLKDYIQMKYKKAVTLKDIQNRPVFVVFMFLVTKFSKTHAGAIVISHYAIIANWLFIVKLLN